MTSETKQVEPKEIEFEIDCNFLKIAREYPVSSIKSKKGKIIELSSESSPEEGFKVLIDNNIQSAPVYNAELRKFTGFLDIRQLTTTAVFGADESNAVFERWHLENQGITTDYLASRNAFNPIGKDKNIAEAAAILGTGVHRVPVMDENGDVINIISQIDIVHFYADHLEGLEEETSGTLDELSIGIANVVTVNQKDSALSVFSTMSQKRIMSIPIVDGKGSMVGQTRGHDLEIYLHKPQTLDKPIKEFLAQIREGDIRSKQPNKFSLFTETDMQLSQAINQLSSSEKHHIFALDKKKRPRKIVSVGDIVRYVTKKKCWRYFESMCFGHYEVPRRKVAKQHDEK